MTGMMTDVQCMGIAHDDANCPTEARHGLDRCEMRQHRTSFLKIIMTMCMFAPLYVLRDSGVVGLPEPCPYFALSITFLQGRFERQSTALRDRALPVCPSLPTYVFVLAFSWSCPTPSFVLLEGYGCDAFGNGQTFHLALLAMQT